MERRQARQRKLVRIELTEEQRARIRHQLGRNATTVQFRADELEDRIAPQAVVDLF